MKGRIISPPQINICTHFELANTIDDVYQVKCDECDSLLVEVKLVGKIEDQQGGDWKIADFRYSDRLLAYRKRLDGMIGLQCMCGTDTRLSDVEKRERPELFPKDAKTTKKNTAKWGHKDSKIKYNKIKRNKI